MCSEGSGPAVRERREAFDGADLTAPGALERWFVAAPVALAVFDLQGRFQRVNPAFAEMDGVAAADHAGREPREVVPELASVLDGLVGPALREGATIGGEQISARIPAGGADYERHWIAGAFPLCADDGSVHAAVAMLAELRGEDQRASAVRVGEDRLRLALDGTETGFWEWDLGAQRLYWTDGLGPMFGLDRGATPPDFAAFLALIHPDDRAGVEAEIRDASPDDGPFLLEFRTIHPDRSERWIASRTRVVSDSNGRPSKVVGVAGDLTERRRREDALAFLAEAGEALAGSMDTVLTLREIAGLAVPRLADWCAVQLAAGEHGEFENIAVAHVDPEKVRWARQLQERYPPDPDTPTGVPEVIRSGRSELYPEIDDALLRAGARDQEHLEMIRRLRMRSAMIVPLVARGRTLGAITFIFAESGRQYSTEELELAEELGRRAGLALDHARLYAREHRTAETLQRALLPPKLPDVPGHELGARYLPGVVGDHIGGDWYDAFELIDGRYGIAIGDIGGRGVPAAALMGQVRNALRAYALKAPGPAAALSALREMGDRLDQLDFATLTYIVYDAATGEGRLANAGHLPALVRAADGTTSFLEEPASPPLGAGAEAPSAESSFTLAPGSTLVLYTDGLVESREHSLENGLGRLAVAAGASAGDVQQLADDILAALPEQREDDVALLALRRLDASR
jgi:serine phosphatase RsbU (regulator of sigma subunit)/PAS domain-containing protein